MSSTDTISGGAGNDVIFGGTMPTTPPTLPGGQALDGGTGNDTITGGTGLDSITGGTGNDVIFGGAIDQSPSGHDGAAIIVVGRHWQRHDRGWHRQ